MRYSRFLHISQQIRKTLTLRPHAVARNHQSQLQSRSAFFARNFNTASQDSNPAVQSEKVSAIVDELTGLTLLEVMDLVEEMQKKKGINELPLMMLMTPGMELGGLKGVLKKGGAKGGGGGGGAGEEEKKEAEKTVFDVKLDAFDAAAKIKVIKEVRSFTSLGLKEAKDLVEKVPTVLKKGVTKEEAETIVAKMKEVGAKVSME